MGDEEVFFEFPKMARYARDVIVTEKIDGTNAQVVISDDGTDLRVGSRNRYLTAEADNHGFHRWAMEHREELLQLGPGRHYGEWWGSGIGRGYGLQKGEKRFSLFNATRWAESRPACCHVVPVLWTGNMVELDTDLLLLHLLDHGSWAAPGFMRPEGIVVYHVAGNVGFKRTLERDHEPKGAWQG
jgi:hypothetical protein